MSLEITPMLKSIAIRSCDELVRKHISQGDKGTNIRGVRERNDEIY